MCFTLKKFPQRHPDFTKPLYAVENIAFPYVLLFQFVFFLGVNGGREDSPPEFYFKVALTDQMEQTSWFVLHCQRKKRAPVTA